MGQDTAYDLQRFVNAQDGVFDTALAELRAGSKSSHWMWFIFPQLQSLGRSSTAQYYGIVSLDEARAYLRHALLGSRLRRAVEALLMWAGKRSPERILGPVDAVKLRSSLTLFDAVEPGAIFAQAIDALFGGERDPMTLELLSPE
jgi:uncharacterized protein (DUF1810 family)